MEPYNYLFYRLNFITCSRHLLCSTGSMAQNSQCYNEHCLAEKGIFIKSNMASYRNLTVIGLEYCDSRNLFSFSPKHSISYTISVQTFLQRKFSKVSLSFHSLPCCFYSATNSTGATQGFLTNQKPIR